MFLFVLSQENRICFLIDICINGVFFMWIITQYVLFKIFRIFYRFKYNWVNKLIIIQKVIIYMFFILIILKLKC